VANAIATAFLNGILGSHATRVDLDLDTIKLALIDHGVATPLPATHDFYDDFNTGLVTNGLSSALGSKTIGTLDIGVFDAGDMAPGWTSVSGATVESVNLIKDTGTPASSDFIAYWDTASGLPLTPNGGDVNVTFNASGIIKV
jgi:hypothetical protein